MSDIIAERVLELRDGETSSPITVRIYRPEIRDGQWHCAAELAGLPEVHLDAYGADSAQALMQALDAVGGEVRRRGLTAEAGHPWPVRLEPITPIESPRSPPLPPEVIAEAEIERFADDEHGSRKGLIQFFKPVPTEEHHWRCSYRITGIFDEERVKDVNGGGSVDALQGALFRASSEFWHVPAVIDEGLSAREFLRLYADSERTSSPLLMRHLRAIGPETPWLVDLDAGVQALRQFYRWVEATKETLEKAPGLVALERSLRYLQAAKGKVEFPAVEDWDISRIVELRKVVEGMPLPQLPDGFERLVYDALRSWWRMSSELAE